MQNTHNQSQKFLKSKSQKEDFDETSFTKKSKAVKKRGRSSKQPLQNLENNLSILSDQTIKMKREAKAKLKKSLTGNFNKSC